MITQFNGRHYIAGKRDARSVALRRLARDTFDIPRRYQIETVVCVGGEVTDVEATDWNGGYPRTDTWSAYDGGMFR